MEAGKLIKYPLGTVKDFAVKSPIYFSDFRHDESLYLK
jgi:hypothetical protein